MTERYSLTLQDRPTILPGDSAPAVRRDGSIALLRWGILPRFRGHGGKRPPTIYTAHLGALETTPLLRDAFAKQRCLVHCDGLYARAQRGWEWLAAGELAALAGIAATSKDDGIESFALLEDHRGALVIPRDAWDDWLRGPPETARGLAAPPSWKRREPGNPNQGSLF